MSGWKEFTGTGTAETKFQENIISNWILLKNLGKMEIYLEKYKFLKLS
jgi:hypothetical protein